MGGPAINSGASTLTGMMNDVLGNMGLGELAPFVQMLLYKIPSVRTLLQDTAMTTPIFSDYSTAGTLWQLRNQQINAAGGTLGRPYSDQGRSAL